METEEIQTTSCLAVWPLCFQRGPCEVGLTWPFSAWYISGSSGSQVSVWSLIFHNLALLVFRACSRRSWPQSHSHSSCLWVGVCHPCWAPVPSLGSFPSACGCDNSLAPSQTLSDTFCHSSQLRVPKLNCQTHPY